MIVMDDWLQEMGKGLRAVKVWLLGVTLILVLTACGTMGRGGAEPMNAEDIVRQRAQERVDALMAGRSEEAYGYASPAYRKVRPLGRYLAQYGGAAIWTAARVGLVVCEEDVCDVQVIVTYYVPGLDIGNTRPLDEKWIFSERQWWILPPI